MTPMVVGWMEMLEKLMIFEEYVVYRLDGCCRGMEKLKKNDLRMELTERRFICWFAYKKTHLERGKALFD